MCVQPAAGTLDIRMLECWGRASFPGTNRVRGLFLTLPPGCRSDSSLTQRLHSDHGSVSTGVEIGLIESDTVRVLGKRIIGAFLSFIDLPQFKNPPCCGTWLKRTSLNNGISQTTWWSFPACFCSKISLEHHFGKRETLQDWSDKK